MKFSVLLPTRNRLELLSRAIETVMRQDYANWEIIVSDNFSDEDISGYIRSLGEPRIKYFRTNSFVPVTDNWNNALEKCDGDYIVMLGDDDGLMRGYFSTLLRLVEKFESPDLVYTCAFLYAYPGVVPGSPKGFLKSYNQRTIYQSAKEPFLLKTDDAINFVKDSMDFRVTFDYNMQFSLVSKKLVNKMKCYGSFYQSPYPDYYASNAMMLKAEQILVVPMPLVTIGISPKSFGYYYVNDAEATGNEFLNNLPDREMVSRLKDVILPGTVMNTSWLISMETLADNFSKEFSLKVNYARYRFIQICSIYIGVIIERDGAKKLLKLLNKKIRFGERLRYGLMFSVITMFLPDHYRQNLAQKIQRSAGSHPAAIMPTILVGESTILDVFEKVDPHNYEGLVQNIS
jgi:glycosyltransferase involved in cell wall biosynthesis